MCVCTRKYAMHSRKAMSFEFIFKYKICAKEYYVSDSEIILSFTLAEI